VGGSLNDTLTAAIEVEGEELPSPQAASQSAAARVLGGARSTVDVEQCAVGVKHAGLDAVKPYRHHRNLPFQP
jgi:hypothetical protein